MAAVEVAHLVKRYRAAQRNAVDDISFDVPEGQLYCLLGPNGAGKTTTVSILTTTLAPTSGRVLIAGRDLAGQQGEARRELGVVFQQPSLDLNLTAEENIRLHAVLYGLYPWRAAVPPDAGRLSPSGAEDGECSGSLRQPGTAGAHLVRRHAAKAGDRPGADAPAPRAVPGRADRGP